MTAANDPVPQPAKVLSVPAFALTLLFTVAGLAGVFVVAAYWFDHLFGPRTATTGTGSPKTPATPSDAEPYVQKGTVKPEGEGSGVVYYPMPYGSPPNLSVEPKARYLIVKQDEFGFTWLDRARTADAIDLLASVPEVSRFLPKGEAPKFDPKQPELVWEARGVRAAPGTQPMKLFEQTGTFTSDLGQQGQVNFPLPYASPPNVELSGNHRKTVITECTATGFKWKNSAKDGWGFEVGPVTWKAAGIRATELPKG